MSENNRNQRNSTITSAAAMAAAVAAGLAFEHMHAQSNQRESLVQGLRRVVSDTVSDITGTPRSSSHEGGASTHDHGNYDYYNDYDNSGRNNNHSRQRSSRTIATRHEQPRQRRGPLSEAEINALPVRIVSDVDSIDGIRTPTQTSGQAGNTLSASNCEKSFCVVCREPYVRGDRLLRLPCFHEFHSECIRDYLMSTNAPLCPICRHPVTF